MAGFLSSDDRLGAVIKRDAEYLLSVGVSRHEIAAFLEMAISRSSHGSFHCEDGSPDPATLPDAKLSVTSVQYCGRQEDPFHPTLGNPAAKHTHSDFTILPQKIAFPGLITTLIRRLCFFESTRYRVDPAHIVPLLKRQAELQVAH